MADTADVSAFGDGLGFEAGHEFERLIAEDDIGRHAFGLGEGIAMLFELLEESFVTTAVQASKIEINREAAAKIQLPDTTPAAPAAPELSPP